MSILSHSRWTGLVLSAVMVACQPVQSGGQAPAPGPAEPPPPQVLNVGIPAILASLDPHNTAGAYVGQKFTIFDTVTRVDSKGVVGPWLAESWGSVDPTTWEFKLRPNVKFSNGEPMDAASIKFTIDRILNPANKLALLSRIPLVTGAIVVDASTVRITTKEADAILPARMSAIFVVPPNEVTKLGADFGLKPVGTGPFKVVEYKSDTRLVLEKYGESWRKSKLDKLTFLTLPEKSTRFAALRNGDVQLAYDPPLDQIPNFEAAGLVVAATSFARVHVVSLDQLTEDSPVRNKLVRQAMNYAVDKEAIVKKVMNGHGKVAEGQLVGPAGYGYDPSIKAYPYDVAKAKQLLAQAGYPNGFTIKMEASATNNKDEVLAYQGYLRDVGINVELQILEQTVWLDHFYARNGTKRTPLFMFLPNYFPAMDADFPFQYFKSDSLHLVYSRPEVDRLYAASTVEVDPAKRLALLRQISQILHEDPPVIFGVEPEETWMRTKTVNGFEPRSDNEPNFETISITK